MARLSTDTVRTFLSNTEESDDFDIIAATEALWAHCDALDEGPLDYGFEFEPEDEHFGNEGQRDHYYLFRYPQERLEPMTAKLYIEAPDDGAIEDAEIVRYEATLLDDRGEVIWSSADEAEFFDTVGACVAWINKMLGMDLIKRVPA